jgi:hypothetical protein
MRRFYNNGTGFLETITKGVSNLTPGGAAANVVKKVIKSKEYKKSRNPDPKTPKMMGTDKETKDKTEIPKRLGRDDEIKRKQFEKKFPKFKYKRQMSKFKKEVPPIPRPKKISGDKL